MDRNDPNYKGSPFLNIGPHIQKEKYEKIVDIEYSRPGSPNCQQFQKHPLIQHDPNNKIINSKLHYENKYDIPFITNEGYQIVIKEFRNKYEVLIEFVCSGYQTVVTLNAVKTGAVKYPYHPNKWGGYFGNGPYTKRQHIKIYVTWTKILERILDPIAQQKSRNRSYIGVSLCFDWYNYQNFAYWMDNYLQTLNNDISIQYTIDKDILQWGNRNKIYGPYTCCIIPDKLNIALSIQNNGELPSGVNHNNNNYSVNMNSYGKDIYLGTYKTPEEAFLVYKEAKEKYIQELAEYYYSINAIHKEVRDNIYRIDIQPDSSEKLR